MTEAHHRYEQMAVGHVLGGLDPVDAADFRSHLVGCRHCRLRVAELRGIASELAAAEREERAAARVKTEVARREEAEEPPREPGWRLPSRAAGLATVLVVLVAVGLLAWNFHLRDVNRSLLAAVQSGERVLSILASGERVPVELHGDARGLVVVQGSDVAVDLAGLPTLSSGRWLGLWLLDGDEVVFRDVISAGEVPEGRVAAHIEHRGADRLLVTVEEPRSVDDGPSGADRPRGGVVAEARLP